MREIIASRRDEEAAAAAEELRHQDAQPVIMIEDHRLAIDRQTGRVIGQIVTLDIPRRQARARMLKDGEQAIKLRPFIEIFLIAAKTARAVDRANFEALRAPARETPVGLIAVAHADQT